MDRTTSSTTRTLSRSVRAALPAVALCAFAAVAVAGATNLGQTLHESDCTSGTEVRTADGFVACAHEDSPPDGVDVTKNPSTADVLRRSGASDASAMAVRGRGLITPANAGPSNAVE